MGRSRHRRGVRRRATHRRLSRPGSPTGSARINRHQANLSRKGMTMADVIVVIGPGQIGQAIARRVGVGKHLLLADVRQENADAAAEVLGNAGYEASVATVDVASREAVHALVEAAMGLGDVSGLIHAAGVSPTQASPATILKVDLYGTALVLEEFGNVIARGAPVSSPGRSP